MFLQSEHIYLRALEPDDLEFLYNLENNIDIWQVSNTTTPYSKQVLQQYLEQAAADIFAVKQLRLLIHTHQNKAVGAIDLFDFEPLHQRAGIGIVIAPPYRQMHYATEALQLILKYCREHLLLHQVFCSVSSNNVSSLRLFEKAGFSLVGTRQQWLRTVSGWQDTLEFQKFLSE